MQTSKVKTGELYAMKRGDTLVRFLCTEIVTRKSSYANTFSEFFGNIVEDQKDGEKATKISVNPQDLLGPYEEQAELVARRDKEAAEREAKKETAEKRARADRLALYEFVGVEPHAKRDHYDQLFRCSFGSVDISRAGIDAIVARVHAFREGKLLDFYEDKKSLKR